ncbi:hypothetical protein WT60_25755 [Burkholderia sp. MSMB617WGS]|uniref:Uncharacterized protein n=1 Tax=Burkholderia savannae TaxID=1637837 RepID=A0ABR5T5G8_9BURK|nr:hypothetical protein WT60_25755 [Burkholderia sp. MSMB617WGS]KVK81813.1 hypothetical protein WS91_10485 [Burkholderia sp. MSMB1498]KWZ38466.1 hypothetical protein WS72_26900 [Burkholderia savannae]KWZ47472.1 hypothetical protein WS73_02480 [Burkholderia savannae]
MARGVVRTRGRAPRVRAGARVARPAPGVPASAAANAAARARAGEPAPGAACARSFRTVV